MHRQNIEEVYYSETQESFDSLKDHYKDIFDDICVEFLEDKKTYIDRGRTAEIHYFSKNPNICVKIIAESTIDQNDRQDFVSLKKEADFLFRVGREITGTGVNVPTPYFCGAVEVVADESSSELFEPIQVLAMKKIDGVSIKNILEHGADIPEGFDMDSFFKKIDNFLEKLHERGIFHRDFHEGNIMIGKNGEPYVIDFGLSIDYTNEENAYHKEGVPGHVSPYPKDENLLRMVRRKLQQYLTNLK